MPLGELAQRAGELDPARPVAVICATGNRSQSGAAVLGQKGFKTIYNVRGGTLGWMRRGFTLEK
jgi:rhodanese-related sulfurtransferase